MEQQMLFLVVLTAKVALNAATATKILTVMTAVFTVLQVLKSKFPAIQGKWAVALNIIMSVTGVLVAIPPSAFFSWDTMVTAILTALGAAGIHGTWSSMKPSA